MQRPEATRVALALEKNRPAFSPVRSVDIHVFLEDDDEAEEGQPQY